MPTIHGEQSKIKIGKLLFTLWDFAGQEQFSMLWNIFIKGSDAVLIITDSTLENIEKSRYFIELVKEQSPNAFCAVIGNKQDIDGCLPPLKIERLLGLKTYSMIANNPKNRIKMIQIIADILRIDMDLSPLLKPLKVRELLLEEAELAINNGNIKEAILKFEILSDLCLQLGEDGFSKECYEKAQQLRKYLEQSII
ncbi:hypothetical protein ES705_38021 [subsurface metagenome]